MIREVGLFLFGIPRSRGRSDGWDKKTRTTRSARASAASERARPRERSAKEPRREARVTSERGAYPHMDGGPTERSHSLVSNVPLRHRGSPRLARTGSRRGWKVSRAATLRASRAPSQAIRTELIRPVAAFSTNARDEQANSEAMEPASLAVTNPRDFQRFVAPCDARTGTESITTARARPIGARVH